MPRQVPEYRSNEILIRYDPGRCIHAAECVRGLPRVFNIERKPWIDPEGAEADRIAEVIRRCPSGALQFERLDGGTGEEPEANNAIALAPDGPIYMRGSIQLLDENGRELHRDTRLALCRCGGSRRKPFCDGSHSEVGFTDRQQAR